MFVLIILMRIFAKKGESGSSLEVCIGASLVFGAFVAMMLLLFVRPWEPPRLHRIICADENCTSCLTALDAEGTPTADIADRPDCWPDTWTLAEDPELGGAPAGCSQGLKADVCLTTGGVSGLSVGRLEQEDREFASFSCNRTHVVQYTWAASRCGASDADCEAYCAAPPMASGKTFEERALKSVPLFAETIAYPAGTCLTHRPSDPGASKILSFWGRSRLNPNATFSYIWSCQGQLHDGETACSSERDCRGARSPWTCDGGHWSKCRVIDVRQLPGSHG